MSNHREKFTFIGHGGESLAALLERPGHPPRATALFAHCFTCSKDIVAASRISRALVARGFAVMRFDFTGLGNSDGDFANTNFSSNVGDLVSAANALAERGLPVDILIGHSLGGTAVLNAAHELPSCRGIVTIGSPADAQHVSKQFAADVKHIREHGEAEVSLAGRTFTIRQQFLDDIEQTSTERLAALKPALLVLHSPVDATVSIDQAERIYKAARHPKSFVSLVDADHLLSKARDADYVSEIIAAWGSRFLAPAENQPAQDAQESVNPGELQVEEMDHRFKLGVYSDSHRWFADEPVKVGGSNSGPDPYEHLLASVGTCTAMTVRMYAARKQWPLDDVRITLRHQRTHQTDCEECSDDKPVQLDVIDRDIKLLGNLDDTQRMRLMAIADRCPVHRTLTGKLDIRTREVD